MGQPLFLPILFSLITMLNLKYIDLNITSNSRSIKKTLLVLEMCLFFILRVTLIFVQSQIQ